jgi:hypothetical protein
MSGAQAQAQAQGQGYDSLQPLNMVRAMRGGASMGQLNAMNPTMPRQAQFLPPALQSRPMQNYYQSPGQQSGSTAFGGMTGFAQPGDGPAFGTGSPAEGLFGFGFSDGQNAPVTDMSIGQTAPIAMSDVDAAFAGDTAEGSK